MVQKVFFIKTFGCQMNERDSEIIAQTLADYGYVEGMEMVDADLVILNTCSIRAKAEQKVMSLLGYLRKAKARKPEMKICVAGCVAQQEGKKIIDKMGHVDLVVGTQNIYDIGKLLHGNRGKDSKVVIELKDKYDIPRFLPEIQSTSTDTSGVSPAPLFRKFVTIMQGCNNYCSYCVVPYTRGREASRSALDIVDEIKVLVEGGVKEITLLGQNVNSYGRTNSVIPGGGPYSFSNLLREVAEIDGLQRLRFTTSNPKDLDDDLINCFRDIGILCPQFHLPVQSGSNSVLERMNRKYDVELYLTLISKLHDVRSGIAFTTDIIVGFPGETEEEFRETMVLLEKVRFHGSFSFKYSNRPGTKAVDYPNQVDESVKSERLAIFQKRQDEISLERNSEYIGEQKEVMLEEVTKDSAKGRTDTNHIVHLNEEMSCQPGDFVDVKIIHAGQHSLKGKKL